MLRNTVLPTCMNWREKLEQCMDKCSCKGKKTTTTAASPNITSPVKYPQSVVVCAEWSKLTVFAVPQPLLSHRLSVVVELLKLLRLPTPSHKFPPPNSKLPLLTLETYVHSLAPAQLFPTQKIVVSLQTQLPTASPEPTSPVHDFLALHLSVAQRAARVWISLYWNP